MYLINKWKLLLVLLSQAAHSLHQDTHRSCLFNALCTCSNAGPDLGSVNCIDVPFITIPEPIKHSAIYIMKLQNNKMRVIENNSLSRTGLWKLQINKNLFTNLPAQALSGLEKTLSILDLSDNNLVSIPKEALSKLEKLQILNLAKNHISTVHSDDIFQLGKTLKEFDLSENSLSHIHNDAFRNMESLESLNLAMNSIVSINDVMLNNRFYSLKHINLMENQLRQVPLTAVANLKKIKSINLSKNIISTLSDELNIKTTIVLEELNLEYNLLQELQPYSFKHYLGINKIHLKGNPLKVIKGSAFQGTNAVEIDLQDCMLSDIDLDSFQGVENSIQMLDLGYNNLTLFPKLPLSKIQRLILKGNYINSIDAMVLKHIGATLKHLDISGMKMGYFSATIMKHMPNIRYLSFKKQQNNKISKEDFLGSSLSIEELHLTQNSLHTIDKEAFSLPALKVLDISYNKIKEIDNDSFYDIAHTLERLIMHKAFAMSAFPAKAVTQVSELIYLDASSNSFTILPYGSFDFLSSLQYLNLNHNSITEITGRHLSKRNNPQVKVIKLAFNKLTTLVPYTFNSMKKLLHIELHDNIITSIKRSAFVDLDSITTIDLEGNHIRHIDDDAFQNLPNIQFINFAYNHLENFNMNSFVQVGRLSTLKINVNHNKIQYLLRSNGTTHSSSNIKILSFSNNNISFIDDGYFEPVKNSLIILDLSVNCMKNLTNEAFSNMGHLQVVTFAQNEITYLSDSTFDAMKNLQILNISYNNISELPSSLFENQKMLRIFDVSANKLRHISPKVFQSTSLEQLILAYNEIKTFPSESLKYANETLYLLDLSGNHIETISNTNMMYMRKLKTLILSNNKILSLDSEAVSHLQNLISLDVSYNGLVDSNSSTTFLNRIPNTIETINMAHNNLTLVPSLYSSALMSLNLSSNAIASIPYEVSVNLSGIQSIDLSNNELSHISKNIWSNLPQLRSLSISSNKIQNFLNDSFVNLKKLQKLHIHNMKFDNLSSNMFSPLVSLKLLEIDVQPNIKGFNLSELLEENHGIKYLHLHLQQKTSKEIFKGTMPKSLSVVTLQGNQIEELEEQALHGINSKNLVLNIYNTNISRLSSKFFKNLSNIQNFTAVLSYNKLESIGKIPIFPEEEENKKLENLELSGNQLNCDCSVYWIWDWINDYEYMNKCHENEYYMYDTILSHIRETKCHNKNNSSIIDVFKTELQCFSRAWTLNSKNHYMILLIIGILLKLAQR